MIPKTIPCEFCGCVLPVSGNPSVSRMFPLVLRWYAYHYKPDGRGARTRTNDQRII